MNTQDVVGVILAGGRSRRLGRDKVGLAVSGRGLLQRTAELAARFCREVYVSGRDPSDVGLEMSWFPDEIKGIGPIGGIYTGLRLFKKPCLILSCDLPLLNEKTVEDLLAAREKRGSNVVLTTYRCSYTGYIESLVSVYEPIAVHFLEKAISKGQYKLSAAIPASRRLYIDYGTDQGMVFFNINYPRDLAELERVAGLVARPLDGARK